jgi:hypothetical protein
MTDNAPSPLELAQAPELAVLHLLESALLLTQRALVAVYPEIEQEDFFPTAPPLTNEAWLADSIGTHIAGLQCALDRYRALMRRHSAPSSRNKLEF